MRTKLTEIISPMDQFNGIGKYSDEYEDGEKVFVDSEMPDAQEATINNSEEQTIEEMLQVRHGINRLNERVNYVTSYVKPFNQFLKEYNGPPSSNIQSYFGCLDDVSDEEDDILDDEE